MASGCSVQPAVARQFQHAQHEDRLGGEIVAAQRLYLAVGENESGFQQAGSGSVCTAGSPIDLRIIAGSSTRPMRVTSRAVRK